MKTEKNGKTPVGKLTHDPYVKGIRTLSDPGGRVPGQNTVDQGGYPPFPLVLLPPLTLILRLSLPLPLLLPLAIIKSVC